ncbi:MAG: hypothetical protein JWM87_4492 [Candidatus Eremiobacteraeota bacterium]|nr:hypothetical protein [Candidatus Eremiobacteraeota bacterium]
MSARTLVPLDATLNLKLVFMADVLGFSDMVRSARTLSTGRLTLDRFRLMVDDASTALDKHRPPGLHRPRTWNIRTYTDNFLLETRLQKGGRADLLNVLQAAAAFQYALVRHGFLSRGAISIGYNYTKDKVIFGQALVEAHDLESTIAAVPRIILANSVRRLLAHHFSEDLRTNRKPPGISPPILEDHDGQWFINYLTETLARDGNGETRIDGRTIAFHRELLITNLGNNKLKQRVREKYIWAAGYHNWFLSKASEVGRSDLTVAVLDAVTPAAPKAVRLDSMRRMQKSFNRRIEPGDNPEKDAVRIAARPRPRNFESAASGDS